MCDVKTDSFTGRLDDFSFAYFRKSYPFNFYIKNIDKLISVKKANIYFFMSPYFNKKRYFFGKWFVPLENFSLIWRRHHDRWRAVSFDLCSAPIAIEHWGFYSVLHIIWHEAFVYNVNSEDLWHSNLCQSPHKWTQGCGVWSEKM